jgi:phage shock protein A
MALLERVGTLIRANLNDLIDKAEDPEKMLKQVILDMQNQLLQVKTQVAIAIADQHVLIKKKKENGIRVVEWKRKAELAVEKQNDDLARVALERSLGFEQMARSFDEQIADQAVQVENLKNALSKLEMKLEEARSKAEILIAQHRRARVANRVGDAQAQLESGAGDGAFDRMNNKVMRAEALGRATAELAGREGIEDQFAKLEKHDEIERLLAEIKTRKGSAA